MATTFKLAASELAPQAMDARAERMRQAMMELGVKPAHIRVSLARAAETGEALATIMRDFGFLSAEQVAEAVARATGLRYFSALEAESIERADIHDIKLESFNGYVPVGHSPDGALLVAVSDEEAINDARNELFEQGGLEMVIASQHTIQTIYRRYFANTECDFDVAVEKFMKVANSMRRREESEEGAGLVQDVFGKLLRHACYSGASDLYMFKSEHVGVLKLKINGTGQIFRTIDPELYDRLLNKLVTENTKAEDLRRHPKEATIKFPPAEEAKYQDILSRFGFRLELSQTRDDRHAVIRMLDKQANATDVKRLGFDPDTLRGIERIANTSTGLFIVTGPTGSGKTTTLYSILKEIDPVERSIQSIENPIEYRHGLWQQYEVRKDAENEGDEYNIWLKALLRNAPDVILVGEVRDSDVARILLDASNTGHLAFSTLHTNNAALALARLKQLRVDMGTLGSVLLGILAQRLVRVLCPTCKVRDGSEETREILRKATPDAAPSAFAPHKEGPGCENCDHTGYRGRRMVYELLTNNSRVRTLIEEGAAPSAIAAAGIPVERTMWATGLRLVESGVTSLRELRRVVVETGEG